MFQCEEIDARCAPDIVGESDVTKILSTIVLMLNRISNSHDEIFDACLREKLMYYAHDSRPKERRIRSTAKFSSLMRDLPS